MKIIGMIPARLGSQRLIRKNLQPLKGLPLIAHAIKKAKECQFDEVWVNSESDEIGLIAEQEGVFFHKRPESLANNQATSEDFVYEFLRQHKCDYLVQLHSIAPLFTIEEIDNFIQTLKDSENDVLLSVERIGIECMYQNEPINFTFNKKQNSQELMPIHKVSWSITGWKSSTYINAYEMGKCATYYGTVGVYEINKFASHVIKDQFDLDLAEILFDHIQSGDIDKEIK